MSGRRATLEVRVTPRASRRSVVRRGTLVCVAVPEPPAENQANEAVVALLAKTLGIARSAVEIVAGGKGRTKRVIVHGLTDHEALARIEEA